MVENRGACTSPTDAVPSTPAIARLLGLIVELTGQTPAQAVEAALDAYFRAEIIRLGNEGYAALRADPEAWAQYQAELKAWDVTLMDGVDPNEHWLPDGTCEIRELAGDDHARSAPR
jgi:hypothetical protein